MKIVVFGVGKIYKKFERIIESKDKIVGFIDNKIELQGEKINGIEIYSPVHIHKLFYDEIVIMSDSFLEMKDQLLQMGCCKEDIISYIEYVDRQRKGKMQVFFADRQKICKNKCLIVTSALDYHGGAIVAVYTALELIERGYETVILAPDGDEQFIDEFSEKGIIFCIYPNLKFAKWSEMFWIDAFQTIIVNTYPMILCALEICKHRKVIVWLHESDIVYSSMLFWKDKIVENILNPNIYIYAVSNVAKRNFIRNVSDCSINVLPYGIPDLKLEKLKKKDTLTFAMIGTIHPIKQQLLYLDAIRNLDILGKSNHEFLIIGKDGNNVAYTEKVKEEAKNLKFKNVKFIGGLKKEELEEKYKDIDVVVVASSQESMSLIATEAMMHNKVCIVCDAAGMAEFIENRINGLICKTNDVESLSEQMTYCIKNRNNLEAIGSNARMTYCERFTLKIFGDKLEREIMNING